MSSQKYFITSALPYVNNVPHLGNIIGSTLSADVYARFMKKCGKDVLFLCGTDEYGTTTEIKALKEHMTCQEICDKYRAIHKAVYDWFNISFDVFGKTTTDMQTEVAQDIFLKLWKNGFLVSKDTQQYFCSKCDRFVCDRYIIGKCYHPNCGGMTKGDQCDDCCGLIDLDKLVDKWCYVCKSKPEVRQTKHLYLKTQEFASQLKKYFVDCDASNDSVSESKSLKYISKSALKITDAWLSHPLEDRCITRDLKWGTPVPKIEGLEEYWDKVFYVWFDAPIGYISILKNARVDWLEWLQSNWVAFMAKDNVPFHTIIFPATLLGSQFGDNSVSCGITHLSATEYLTFDGKKFSKSENVGLFGNTVMDISAKLGIDADYWRYYLLKIRPQGSDSSFKLEEFVTIIKGELSNKMGNLLNRILMLAKDSYPYSLTDTNSVQFQYDFAIHDAVLHELCEIYELYMNSFRTFDYHVGIKAINRITEIGNEWFQAHKLWIICKNGNEENKYLLGNAMYIMWLFAELCEPFMPTKSAKIKTHFHIQSGEQLTFPDIEKLLSGKSGYIYACYDNIELLFRQPKLADVIQLLE